MKKPMSTKKQAVKELKFYIGLSRKTARQINRKLETLGQINKAKMAAKQRLVEICLKNGGSIPTKLGA